MAEFKSNERRLVLRILEYWNFLRGEAAFPAPDGVDPAQLGDDWRDCLLLTLGGAPEEATFRYAGASLLANSRMRSDWLTDSPRSIIDCPPDSLVLRATSYVRRVTDKRVPISLGDSYIEGTHVVKFRSILLPLSSDGERIDGLLGAANCMRVPVMQGAPVDAE